MYYGVSDGRFEVWRPEITMKNGNKSINVHDDIDITSCQCKVKSG